MAGMDELERLLARDWCPKCLGLGHEIPPPPDEIDGQFVPKLYPLENCNLCQGTGRVWSQDKRAWLARDRSESER